MLGRLDGGRALLSLVVFFVACAEPRPAPREREADAQRQRAVAVEKLRARDPDAYLFFKAVPADTRAGRQTRRDLERADVEYREGIQLLERGEEDAARGHFDRARRIAPIDPRLYRPLGRAYETRGMRTGNAADFQKAADYYKKAAQYFERRRTRPSSTATARSRLWPLAGAVAALFLLAAGLFFAARARRGETLEELAAASPEMHPQIAYLAGALRHELLKHRIGAVSDALAALRASRTSLAEIEYLAGRLFGGEPIARVWESHVDAFERASGGRLNLRHRDRMFRRAGRALRAIGRLRPAFAKPTPALARRLGRLHEEVRAFDRWLKALAERLTLAEVDSALLREVVYAVQQEHAAGAVHVDEIRYGDIPPDVRVEVFRTDLVIVLKNVVRNAILAMAEEPPRRALGFEVRVEPEPTGDESVAILVSDTSRQPLTTEAIYERKLDRGLGLVTAALDRYNGSIAVEAGTRGFRKAVALRFFRAMGG